MNLRKVTVVLMLLVFACPSFGQECLGDLISKEVRCCSIGTVQNSVCQGSIGNSCENLLTLRQCTLTCSIGQEGTCQNARVKAGPVAAALQTPADSDSLEFTADPVVTGCGRAFAEWLQKTMANRKLN